VRKARDATGGLIHRFFLVAVLLLKFDRCNLISLFLRQSAEGSLSFEKHPQIKQIVENFVRENGLEANLKGESATPFRIGSTNKAVRAEVIDKCPEVLNDFPKAKFTESMCVSTCFVAHCLETAARIFTPPSAHSGSDYKSIVHARRPFASNDLKNDHPEMHESNAMIKNLMEMCVYFRILTVNADNKALVKFNNTAVSRHIQPNTLLLDGQEIHYPMHDFPGQDKILPSAYLVLMWQESTWQLKYYEDKHNRKRIVLPVSGPEFIFNRPTRYFTANIETHVNDLLYLLDHYYATDGALALFADQGTDWEFSQRGGKSSLLNIFYYGLLWMKSRLSVLMVIEYIPENHHQGPVEHSFGSLTKQIAGATLKLDLDNLGESEIMAKLDEEINRFSKFWDGNEHDGFPVKAIPVSCSAKSALDKSVEYIKSQIKVAVKNMDISVKDLLIYFVSHLRKTPWTLSYLSCQCAKCKTINWKPATEDFAEFLRDSHAGKLPFARMNTSCM
jgi:hypothetical protein